MFYFAAFYFLLIPFLIVQWVLSIGNLFLSSSPQRSDELLFQSLDCSQLSAKLSSVHLLQWAEPQQFVSRIAGKWKEAPTLESVSAKIYGGYEAPRSTFVYAASVNTTFLSGNYMACTGTVADCKRVLTAAHCLHRDNDSISNIEVRLGQYSDRGSAYRGASAHILASYRPDPPQNDLAFVVIDGMFRDAYRSAAYLNWTAQPPAYVQTAGFGRTEKQSHSSILLETIQQTRSFDFCQEKFSGLEVDSRIEDFDSSQVMCVSDPDYPTSGRRSFCFGDSGGPVFIKRGEKMLQVGVVSFGPVLHPCNYSKSVDWAVNLKSYLPHIQEYLAGDYRHWNQAL